MLQQLIVILIVGVCGAWLTFKAVRFWKPASARGGSGCGAGCCDGKEQSQPKAVAAAGGGGGERIMMIRSDDLRARIAARKA